MKISQLEAELLNPSRLNDGEAATSFYISFSDLMIMLGVFFVMLISISEVEVGSFEKVKAGFSGSTGGTLVELAETLDAIVKDLEVNGPEPNGIDWNPPGVAGVTVEMARDGVRLNLDTATVFDTGSATLKPDTLAPLRPLLEEVLTTEYTIDVEGHTDDVSFRSYHQLNNERILETNWSLSGRRASSVIHFLIDFGFEEDRLRLVGYASTQPLAPIEGKHDEALERARAENRRVSLLIK